MKYETSEDLINSNKNNVLIKERLRNKQTLPQVENKERQNLQIELAQKKLEQLRIRYQQGEIKQVQQKENSKDMSKIEAYK